MKMKRLLKSVKVHASKRTYYFNLYELKTGERVIEVTESRMIATKKFKRNLISIFTADVERFVLTIDEILDLAQDLKE